VVVVQPVFSVHDDRDQEGGFFDMQNDLGIGGCCGVYDIGGCCGVYGNTSPGGGRPRVVRHVLNRDRHRDKMGIPEQEVKVTKIDY
jgi:hypothetical protein